MSTVLPHNLDHTTQVAVEAALKRAPLLSDAAHIGVGVNDGVVTLSGEVPSYPEKVAAGRVALHTTGVTAIANDVSVRHESAHNAEARIEPAAAHDTIQDALVRNANIDADGIKVDVDGASVTLTGTVSSFAEKRMAALAVWSSPDVKTVHNRLRIDTP